MVNLSGLFRKAKNLAQTNPDAVRSGVDKVENVINTRTKGKYADKIAKGSGMVDKALGVPGRSRDAYRDEANRPPARLDTVRTDPIDPPADIDPPRPV